VNCPNSISKAKLRPCSFALSAAAGTRSRLALRNASHFGATSMSRIPIPDKNYGNFSYVAPCQVTASYPVAFYPVAFWCRPGSGREWAVKSSSEAAAWPASIKRISRFHNPAKLTGAKNISFLYAPYAQSTIRYKWLFAGLCNLSALQNNKNCPHLS
jgi:hypothetical protein